MTTRPGLLPREGFTLDVVQRLVLSTVLNPLLTVPLVLLGRFTDQGGAVALDHPTAVRRLTWLAYLGLARWANNWLGQASQNNFTSDKFDWDKEVVLITGGSDGFGKILVQLFAAHNKNTKIVSLDVQKPLYPSPSANFHHVDCDLSSNTEIEEAARRVKEEHGNPSVMILNAGIIRPSTILGMQDANLEKVFQVNILQHFRMTRAFVPAMVARNHGMVVTVSSLAGYVTPAGMADYCSTKSAAISFHEALSAELRDRYGAPRVRTVCVTPNFAHTKLAAGLKNDKDFLSPWLAPETVSEAIFDKVVSGNGGWVMLPRSHAFLGQVARSWPWWMQRLFSLELKHAVEDLDGWKKQ